jgi:hypothetical protein
MVKKVGRGSREACRATFKYFNSIYFKMPDYYYIYDIMKKKLKNTL